MLCPRPLRLKDRDNDNETEKLLQTDRHGRQIDRQRKRVKETDRQRDRYIWCDRAVRIFDIMFVFVRFESRDIKH